MKKKPLTKSQIFALGQFPHDRLWHSIDSTCKEMLTYIANVRRPEYTASLLYKKGYLERRKLLRFVEDLYRYYEVQYRRKDEE